MGLQLGAVKGQRLPALGASLLQHPADGGVGGVRCERELRVFPRMKEHRRVRQSFLGGFEGLLTVRSPVERFWLSFESLEEVVEVCRGVRNEFPVVSDHTKEALKFLDGCRRSCCADHIYLFRKRRDPVFVDCVA